MRRSTGAVGLEQKWALSPGQSEGPQSRAESWRAERTFCIPPGKYYQARDCTHRSVEARGHRGPGVLGVVVDLRVDRPIGGVEDAEAYGDSRVLAFFRIRSAM